MTQCAGGCLAVGKTAKAEVDNIIELLGLYWGLVPLEEKHILALGFMKQTIQVSCTRGNHHRSHHHTWLRWFIENNHNANVLMEKNL